ncbi:MAG: response regulator transcription factor [Planctomycetes bacterium]|nr:response regulator transcription factor [Planctomycetota bacterium]
MSVVELKEQVQVLVVEDQPVLRQSLMRGLSAEGFVAHGASTGAEGYHSASTGSYDVVILDLLLPDGDGIQTLRRLRSEGFTKPVLILTARDSIEDRIQGLDSGADDYLVKPFALGELLARLKALLRRAVGSTQTVLKIQDLVIDVLSRRVTRSGREISLSTRQYELLEFLARNPNQIVSRQTLAENVWRAPTATWTNVIEVQINQLRKKIERPDCPTLISTVRGEGYVLGSRLC